MNSPYDQYRSYSLEKLLQALEVNTEPGASRLCLEHLVRVRTAEMVAQQLRDTAGTIAVTGSNLGIKVDNLNEEIGKTKATIDKAGVKVSLDLQQLTQALVQAGSELQRAGAQSAAAARRLNTFTFVLAAATLLLTLAGAFQAWQAKRQADLSELQIRQQTPAAGVPARQLAPSALPRKR